MQATLSTWQTIKHLVKQAIPVLIGQWAGIAFGVLDSMMLGHTSAYALQTISLAASIYTTIYIGLMGVVLALIPINSQQFGAKQYQQMGYYCGQGLWLGFILAIFGNLLLIYPDVWLSLSGDIPSEVKAEVTHYLRIIGFAMPASIMFRAIYALCTSAQRPTAVMNINLASIAIKLFLNWILIFGNWGAPALGAIGAGIATTVAYWSTLLLGLLIIYKDPFYKKFNFRINVKPDWKVLKEILRLGIPMGGSYFVEVSAFTFMALLAAREGTYVSGAHQILANLTAILYMFPMSLGIATAALAAQAIGAKKTNNAQRIGLIGLGASLIGVVISIILVACFKIEIIRFYTNDPQVIMIASGLLSIMPILHFCDAMQCVNSYLLRAYKIATIPFFIQTLALLGIGLGGGWYFGYGSGIDELQFWTRFLTPNTPNGLSSLWIMSTLSLGTCAIFLHAWYWRTLIKFKAKT